MIKYTDKYYKIAELNCKVSDVPEALRFMLTPGLVFKAPYPSSSDPKYTKGIELLSSIFNHFKIEPCSETNIEADDNMYSYSFLGASLNSQNYKTATFEQSDLFKKFISIVSSRVPELYSSYCQRHISDNNNNEVEHSKEEYLEKIISYARLFFVSSYIKISSDSINSYLGSILGTVLTNQNNSMLSRLFTEKEIISSESDILYIENEISDFLKFKSDFYISFDENITNDDTLNKIVKKYTHLSSYRLFSSFKDILDGIIRNNVMITDSEKNSTERYNGLSLNLLEPYGYNQDEVAKRFNRVVIKWSSIQTKSINFGSTYLKEQIRHRYHLQDRATSGSLNTVIDSFLPSALYNCNMDSEKIRKQYSYSLSKTAYAMSPYVANLFAVKKAEPKQLCRILGFDEKKIKSMLLSIKLKKLDFVFVGAGGTGINTAIWLKEMCEFSNVSGLFNRVFCFEEDNAELSNLLRFPIDPHAVIIDNITPTGGVIDSYSKLHLIKHAAMQLSSNTPSLVTKFICKDENTLSDFPTTIFTNNMETIVKDDGYFETVNSFRTRSNVVLYGAPDIATRVNLSKAGRFISATHATNSCNVYINPTQDATIQVESYGMIQLAPFFMNQLRMAISLLEILSDDNLDELLLEQDKSVLSYSFDGKSVLKTDRIYNFHIDRNISMMTEDQAQNAGN